MFALGSDPNPCQTEGEIGGCILRSQLRDKWAKDIPPLRLGLLNFRVTLLRLCVADGGDRAGACLSRPLARPHVQF